MDKTEQHKKAMIEALEKSLGVVTTACKSRIADAIVEHDGKRMLDRDKALELWERNTKRNGSERVSADAQHRDRRKLKPDVAGARLPPPAQVPTSVRLRQAH